MKRELNALKPHKPPTLPDLADLILTCLASEPVAGEIIIGGGIALKHYADFRMTQDIDAWWRHARNEDTVKGVEAAMKALAESRQYNLKHRTFGQTDSFEFHDPYGKQIFAFQIAKRDVPLDEPLQSEWPPILIETFRDNLGSKMNALVGRGAPRDFIDIYEIVHRGLATTDECWALWDIKNPGVSKNEAKIDVLTHLERITQRRPLSKLPPGERQHAAQVRGWFHSDFANGIEGQQPRDNDHLVDL